MDLKEGWKKYRTENIVLQRYIMLEWSDLEEKKYV